MSSQGIEDLLFATLDAISRFSLRHWTPYRASTLVSGTPLAPRSRPGPCSPKPRSGCHMASGETGCIAWAWHRGRRERG